jgi:hypothetical protein
MEPRERRERHRWTGTSHRLNLDRKSLGPRQLGHIGIVSDVELRGNA